MLTAHLSILGHASALPRTPCQPCCILGAWASDLVGAETATATKEWGLSQEQLKVPGLCTLAVRRSAQSPDLGLGDASAPTSPEQGGGALAKFAQWQVTGVGPFASSVVLLHDKKVLLRKGKSAKVPCRLERTKKP